MQNRNSRFILGYINRSELQYAINRSRRERTIPSNARCFFTPPNTAIQIPGSATVEVSSASFSGALSIDFARFIDATPLTVHPRLPLETVTEIFKKVGPRAVLVEDRGKLCGIVTRKDVLKFQFQIENREHPRNDDELEGERMREEKLWALIERTASAIGGWLFRRGPTLRPGRERERDLVSDDVDFESPIDMELDEGVHAQQ